MLNFDHNFRILISLKPLPYFPKNIVLVLSYNFQNIKRFDWGGAGVRRSFEMVFSAIELMLRIFEKTPFSSKPLAMDTSHLGVKEC